MTAEVIEKKRQPPLWVVKHGHRYQGRFMGATARAQAEAFAAERYGAFTVRAKAQTGKEARRLATLDVAELA
jgi:hypothetical protein